MTMRTMKGLFLLVLVLGAVGVFAAACTPEDSAPPLAFADLPAGDAANGETLFRERVIDGQRCITCHRLDGVENYGPTLQGYGSLAGGRVADESAEEYTFWSIVEPARFIVPGDYEAEMYDGYASALDAQEIADIIAFMLSQ